MIGENGCGKTTFLKALAAREIPIPEHVDIYHLNGEVPPSDMTAQEVVIELGRQEQLKLEKEAEELMEKQGDDDNAQAVLDDIYDRLDQLDSSKFESKVLILILVFLFSFFLLHDSLSMSTFLIFCIGRFASDFFFPSFFMLFFHAHFSLFVHFFLILSRLVNYCMVSGFLKQ